MKINLAENLLRFGAKNLSEESRKKLSEQPVQNLGAVNVVATNPMGAKFASANKTKPFGALPINGKPAYFYTIPRTGEQAQPVNLIVADIIYSAPSADARYNPADKSVTASVGSMVLVLNSPGYVEDLRLSVSSDGSAKIVGQPKFGKIQYNLYDEKGNALLANQSDVNKFINVLNSGLINSFANAKQVNPMIAGAATVLASTTDTKPGVGTRR